MGYPWNERAKKKRLETFPTRHPERQLKGCGVCGQTFTPRRRGGTTQVFCSKKCRVKETNRLRMLRYPERVRNWWAKNPGYGEKRRAIKNKRVFDAYGGYVCACCGEREPIFLTIDHIDGGGIKHRREIGTDFYRWLRVNKFPPGFRVLCMNCNWATRFKKTCPHQKAQEKVG